MEIDPSALDVSERYKLLVGAIVPRPIAVVSTISRDGKANVAPFSFFNAIGSDPMLLMFCPANKPEGGMKDSMRNALPAGWPGGGGVGEFVVNIAGAGYINKVVGAAEPLAYGESEFELTGLTEAKSVRVKAPRVAESPIAFECETWKIIRTNESDPDAPGAGNMVIGRVVHVHARDGLVDEGMRVDTAALDAVGRLAGLGYCYSRDVFEAPFGRAALEE